MLRIFWLSGGKKVGEGRLRVWIKCYGPVDVVTLDTDCADYIAKR